MNITIRDIDEIIRFVNVIPEKYREIAFKALLEQLLRK